MTVPTLPTAPSRTMDQDTFDAATDSWIAALQNWTDVVNAMGITTLTGTIQSTPIGNVTPSTGAFTTLSAIAAGPNTGFHRSTDSYSLWVVQSNNATGTFGNLWLGANQLANDLATSTVAGGVVVGNQQNYPCYILSNSAVVGEFSSTGLAVTGTISATTTIRTGGYTVATLPAGTTGDRAYVTDATAPTYLGALTGGGAVVCPVFKNASAWVSA